MTRILEIFLNCKLLRLSAVDTPKHRTKIESDHFFKIRRKRLILDECPHSTSAAPMHFSV